MQSLAGLLPAAMQEQMYSKNLTLGYPDIMKALYRLFTKSCMLNAFSDRTIVRVRYLPLGLQALLVEVLLSNPRGVSNKQYNIHYTQKSYPKVLLVGTEQNM